MPTIPQGNQPAGCYTGEVILARKLSRPGLDFLQSHFVNRILQTSKPCAISPALTSTTAAAPAALHAAFQAAHACRFLARRVIG
jgi:hypothetical protein